MRLCGISPSPSHLFSLQCLADDIFLLQRRISSKLHPQVQRHAVRRPAHLWRSRTQRAGALPRKAHRGGIVGTTCIPPTPAAVRAAAVPCVRCLACTVTNIGLPNALHLPVIEFPPLHVYRSRRRAPVPCGGLGVRWPCRGQGWADVGRRATHALSFVSAHAALHTLCAQMRSTCRAAFVLCRCRRRARARGARACATTLSSSAGSLVYEISHRADASRRPWRQASRPCACARRANPHSARPV